MAEKERENDSDLNAAVPLTEFVEDGARQPAGRRRSRVILPDVKDKGYAWVIIAVMWLSNVITAGYIKSFGITYNALKVAYPSISGAQGGIIIALLSGFRSVLAPLVGAAAVQFGYRPVMMLGVTFCSSALFMAYFCSTVPLLSLTLGAMMGIGMCTIETSQVIVLSEYFNKKKELANSLRVSGNPLGGAAFPFILVIIFEHYGLRFSFIILSALLAQLGAFIFLIRPYKLHQRIVLARRKNYPRLDTTEDDKFKTDIPAQKAKKLDFKLFLNPLYWCHLAMIVGFSANMPHAQIFFAVYCKSVGLSDTLISVLLAYQAILDSLTRLLIGFLLNKKLFKKTHCFSLLQVLNFLYPALLGYMVDVTGSYYLTFITMGVGMAFGGLSIGLQPLVAKLAKIDVEFL
ncbi:monocarboxylate transporter 4 [Hyalella azteca]|uniref:Monocarboxylate transporter 4 n=1 Tax=Hyalella azteca TaxID=294128 RepID=A0A8B7N0H8_HYAAZ|nr:monocarboxylate transporter 4 [Hyalella azteca]